MSNTSLLLSAQQLTVEIAGKQVCSELSLGLHAGQRWGLLGINGVGKTTLLHTLAGLRPPSSGQLQLGNHALSEQSPREIAQQLGVLFQAEEDPFPGTVLETVLMGRHPWLGRWQWEEDKDYALAREALAEVSLADFEQRQVNTLSGGERQRTALATLLTQNPRLYLLDEPTNHLDPRHQIELLTLLSQRVTETDRALLMILHDINLATRFCDHLILLFGDGKTLCGPVEEVLNIETLTRLYGHPVIAIEGPSGPVYLPG